MKIKYVDGFEIRRTIMPDYNYSGAYGENGCVYIPKGELWIEKEYKDETNVILANRKVLSKLMETTSYLEARKSINEHLSGTVPMKEFQQQSIKKKVISWLSKLSELHLYLAQKIDWDILKDVNVLTVNGKSVRKYFDIDFVLGGHHYVYDYIPKNEIWLDEKQNPKELKYTFFHELYEYQLMEKGMDYDSAHDFAIAFEKYLKRRDGIANYRFDAEENRNKR